MSTRDKAIVTKTSPFQQFFTSNQSPAAYPTLGNVGTPIKDVAGTILVGASGYSDGSFLALCFWGQGSANNTCNVQIVGYRRWQRTPSTFEYVPLVLADLSLTLGTATSTVTAADKMVNAITVNSGTVTASYEIVPAPTNCAIQQIMLDPKGCEYIRLVPGTGNVTNINGMNAGF